jgi:hypothetical protein
MDEATEPKSGEPKRRGKPKRKKTAELAIHEERKVPTEGVPQGSRFKRYRPYVLHRYHHNHVTQPLLLEQLRDLGIVVSAEQRDRILTEGRLETAALERVGHSRIRQEAKNRRRHTKPRGPTMSRYLRDAQEDLPQARAVLLGIPQRPRRRTLSSARPRRHHPSSRVSHGVGVSLSDPDPQARQASSYIIAPECTEAALAVPRPDNVPPRQACQHLMRSYSHILAILRAVER